MEPIKLDIKDKKILSIIDMNARLSNSQVGKLVGLSRKSVEYRIKKMEDLKVIKRYFCKLNYVNLGYSIYKMFIRLVNIDPNLEQEIEDFSKTNNQFYWFHKYRGRFDFGIGTVVKTIQEYKEFQSTFLERFSVNIAEKSVSQAVSTNFYSHSYIHDKRDFVSYSHSTKQNKNITEIDKKILGLLAKDCKMPIVTMAQQLKVSNSTVSSRIDKMLDNNIILCFV